MAAYITYIICGILTAAAVTAAIVMYLRTSRIMRSMDKMVDLAISDQFNDSDFSETRLSKLETKTRRYLAKGNNARRQLEQDRENLKSTISNLSHQTKTPISNILLYTQLLSEAGQTDTETGRLVSQIEEQTEKLRFLIDSLVKMSRLESGIISLTPRQNNVEELASSLYDTFAPRAEAEGKTLTLDLGAADEPDGDTGIRSEDRRSAENTAVFDRKWTLEAIGNIIDNALKYTDAGGSVGISVTHYNLFARVDITDDGMGITEEDCAKIFGRFYRAEAAEQKQGVGIGLYLTREIISKQNGYIKVASKYGEGSTFSVFLPKANKALAARKTISRL